MISVETQIIELDAPPRPVLRPQVVFPLAIGLGLFGVVIVTTIRPLPFFSVYPLICGLAAGVLLVPIAMLVHRIMRKGAARRKPQLIRERRELPIAERVRALLAPHKGRTYAQEAEVVAALAADGVANVVVLLGNSRNLGRSPVDVPFEPTPLDESAPGFMGIAGVTSAAGHVETRGDRGNHSAFRLPTTWRRRINLGAGWVAILIFATNVVIHGITSIQAGRATSELMYWSVMLVIVVFGVGGFGAWKSTDQWLLVPGGIVRRSARVGRSQWKLHLFTRQGSLLLIGKGRSSTQRVCVADAEQDATAQVTPAEADLLLRAWLSPIPPPGIEQLSDLS